MKSLSVSIIAVLATLATQAAAQAQHPLGVRPMRPLANVQAPCVSHNYGYRTPYNHYPVTPTPWRFHASTAMGSYLEGVATLRYAQGAYNVMTARARAIHAEARSLEIANHEQAVHTYFALRSANREAREAERGPRATPEELVRLANLGKPAGINGDQLNQLTGIVSWPTLLQGEEFAPFRAGLEALLAQRAAFGKLDRDDQQQVSQLARAIQMNLQKQIDSVRPMDYATAQQFIKSLAHEARQPVG